MSRLTATIKRLGGRMIPLGPGEPADSIGMDIQLQGTMPGGQTTASLTVARDPDLRDLDPFDELVVRDAGGVEVWSGYGVEYPARDGEGPQVEISATGWSGYLKDNPPPPLVAVDRSFGSWGDLTPAAIYSLAVIGRTPGEGYTAVAGGDDSGKGLLWYGLSGAAISSGSDAALGYVSPVNIGKIGYRGDAVNTANVLLYSEFWTGADPDTYAGGSASAITLDSTIRYVTLSAGKKAVKREVVASTTHTPASGSGFRSLINLIAVYGDHGLPLYDNGDDGMQGVLGSDLIAWGLRQTCPLLTPEIVPSTFVIPHFVEPELEDMEALIMKANATEIYDWGCQGKRFFYRPPGSGRTWVVRASDPGVSLTDAGEQGEDMFTRGIISYGDFGGRSLKVGYPGSGCDTESIALVDTSNNVLTQRGRPRTLRLSLSVPSTAAKATQVMQRALQEKARLSLRGEASLTGEAQDTNGAWRPVSQIQTGDQIIFADRSWTPRRIVDLTYTESTDVCAVSLDSTPAKLDAILERMGVINEGQNL